MSWFWKGCKPNSVCALAGGENHLSVQPIPETCFAFTKRGAGRSPVSYLALHPMGFSVPRRLRFARCALAAPFHPCHATARESEGGRFDFLWHCPSEGLSAFRPRVSQSNGLGLRGIAPFGVRTFLFRLAPKAILRPSKTANNIPDAGKITSRHEEPNSTADYAARRAEIG